MIILLTGLLAYRARRIMTSITGNPLPSSELEDRISSRTLQLVLAFSDSV
jgi:hypothetical protein